MRSAVEEVAARGFCEARGLIGECSNPLGLNLQVHEKARGPWRRHARQYPEAMLLLCPGHHEWATRNPVQAHAVGLCWGPDSEANLRALGWRSKSDIGYQEER